ncbi:hypothetical protein FOMA001_g9752 [Fusarium oxysporum f. sp. matthiolae]|nr:hypothetical protein FOMA001_g9752 [Fusarium oxysporum f. sp. matthiolae]
MGEANVGGTLALKIRGLLFVEGPGASGLEIELAGLAEHKRPKQPKQRALGDERQDGSPLFAST